MSTISDKDALQRVIEHREIFHDEMLSVMRRIMQGEIDMLLDEESQSVANLSDFIGRPISLQAESGYAQEAFDIILM